MTNHQEISSFIWNVCDDVLRALFKPHEYGETILSFCRTVGQQLHSRNSKKTLTQALN